MKDRKTTPTPVALDDELLNEIDEVAGEVRKSRSAVMRMAIRSGLPLVAERLTGAKPKPEQPTLRQYLSGHALDDEKSFVDIRIDEKIAEFKDRDFAELSERLAILEYKIFGSKTKPVPKTANDNFQQQFYDLLNHCPEAKRRLDLMAKLTSLRKASGEKHVPLWKSSLSNEQIKWEISMYEKYGSDSSSWPKEEITKRDTAVAKKVKMNLPPPLEVRGKKRPKPKNKNTL